jgi:predicted nucleic acid-binding protein
MTTASDPEPQYWDSCLYIDLLLNKRPERVKAILEALREAREGRARIIVSTLVLAEVRPRPDYKADYKQDVEDLLESNYPYVTWYGVTLTIGRLARDIGATHPTLSPADCVHLATALEAGAKVFFTYDGEGKKRRSKTLLTYDNKLSKAGGTMLRITTPGVNPGPMFGGR